jgi:putative oxidoreductase
MRSIDVQKFFEQYGDYGHLILRIGLGASSFFLRGIDQMRGGPERYEELGRAMGNIGIHFWPTFWGFMAVTSECIGGLLLMLGLFVRPTTLFMVFTMFIAGLQWYMRLGFTSERVHPWELGLCYLALTFMGAGKYSLDRKFGFE